MGVPEFSPSFDGFLAIFGIERVCEFVCVCVWEREREREISRERERVFVDFNEKWIFKTLRNWKKNFVTKQNKLMTSWAK